MATDRTLPADTDALHACCEPRDGRLVDLATGGAAPPLARLIHDHFAAFVQSAAHPCVGAKAAVNRQAYRLAVYGRMGSPAAARRLRDDLVAFQPRQDDRPSDFSTFVASFVEPVVTGEVHFEELLWRQLQALHEIDAATAPWDSAVSDDPHSADFSFSVGGRAYFIIGLSPASSRWSRRFAWPTLIFNAHSQFETLRTTGRYQPMRNTIRERDTRLQGFVNPMMTDFGTASEARQYAGRAVPDDWACPFRRLRGGE